MPDTPTVSATITLQLTKEDMVNALLYHPDPHFWWSPKYREIHLACLADLDVARALEEITDTVTSYGSENIHYRHVDTPADVEAATLRAVERLWPELGS